MIINTYNPVVGGSGIGVTGITFNTGVQIQGSGGYVQVSPTGAMTIRNGFGATNISVVSFNPTNQDIVNTTTPGASAVVTILSPVTGTLTLGNGLDAHGDPTLSLPTGSDTSIAILSIANGTLSVPAGASALPGGIWTVTAGKITSSSGSWSITAGTLNLQTGALIVTAGTFTDTAGQTSPVTQSVSMLAYSKWSSATLPIVVQPVA